MEVVEFGHLGATRGVAGALLALRRCLREEMEAGGEAGEAQYKLNSNAVQDNQR